MQENKKKMDSIKELQAYGMQVIGSKVGLDHSNVTSKISTNTHLGG